MKAVLSSMPFCRCFYLSKIFVLLSVFAFSLNAQAGIGSVWSSGVTDTSITAQWTSPSGNYQLSGSTPHYKICYEVKGTLALICNANPPQYSNTNTHTITGLNSDTTYRVRVKCHCKRKNIWGNWVNPKWRNISTMEVTTDETSSVPSYTPSSLTITGTNMFSMNLMLTHNDMPLFDFVRICYKRKYSGIINFNNKCAYDPFGNWLYSDHNVGWQEEAPAQPLLTTMHPTANLKPCTKYDVVGFGYYMGGGYDLIGEAEARTFGSCGFFNKSQVLISDHVSDVVVAYAERLDRIYPQGVFSHLVENYDKNLNVAREAILEQYREDIRDTLTLLIFLVESESKVYEQWQQEDYLVSKGLSIEGFLAREFPDLSKQIDEELLERGNDWGNPL